MVNLSEEISINLGFNSIAIQSSKNKNYVGVVNQATGKMSMSEAEAKIYYDDVAKRLGFMLGPDDNWHKKI